MKIIFRANGRCASAAVDPSGQPITAGSRGIMTEFKLSEDYAGLVVYAVFRSQTATGEQLLSEDYDPVEVPWEVLERPSLTFDVGVVGKNGEGAIVIPTVWARVGRVVTAAVASYMGPDDPSTDIGTQIVERARAAAKRAEDSAIIAKTAASEAETSAEDAASAAVLSESWAVGGTGVREGEDTDNSKFWALVAQMGAQDSGYAIFNVNTEDGLMYVTITTPLDEDVSFAINEAAGTLEVTIHG